MQNDDLIAFIEILDAVAEQYGKSLSDTLKNLYWNGLKDYDFQAVVNALEMCLKNPDNGMFMPKIADVIRMLEGSSQDGALRAWAKVDKSIRSIGTYSTVVFDDALIHKVIEDMGGWIGLGQKKEDELPFVAKEFENRYRGYKSRNEKPEYLPKMIGIIEAQNTKQGYKTDEPILIGNKEDAMSVLSGGSIASLQVSTFQQVLEVKHD
jgi:hypothetical protein